MLLALALASSSAFDPLRFFAGHTAGVGRLHVVLHHAHEVRVEGDGTIAPDGALLLTQRIAEQGKPPRTRRWRIVEQAPGRYTGTLTDAAGPVTVWTQGSALRLRYRTSSGIRINQRITLLPGGHAAHNVLSARKLGIVVARLDETITRAD